MAGPTWLEVALNGPWSRARQPGIPITVDEIVAEGVRCAEAGAAVVHLHAYDEKTGLQRDDPDIYAAIIEGIREKVDAIVYPTIPFSPEAAEGSGKKRYAAVAALAERGLLEWTVVDPGSVNITGFDQMTAGENGILYANPDEHIRAGLAIAEHHGIHPSYAIYEPGFLRQGAHLAHLHPRMPAPIYRLMFSDGFAFGFPPEDYALNAYLELLSHVEPGAPWMVAGLAVDIRPLVEPVLARGGHIRVGLEDAPLGSPWSNLEWVEHAVAMIEDFGGTLATAAEIRAALKTG
ncbi:MAG: 3-keto-5-aminohexanoate cleavage protein [Alphaproteobacteria bacterium]